MATIKAIEGRTIHQIQSGQVIVDLCSVVKELVENSLDAGATLVDVRFKNQGLDAIEVQDNGEGISATNYDTLALKHHTSKLSTYSDLTTLQTFGFRGEALSSLCALSNFSVITCMAKDAPKGTKLDFEISGKLKGTSVIAAQKGTTVVVENLFNNLPVRRRELERNIKREWGRVVSHLNQYACIQTGIKFSVSQQAGKGKKTTVFSTKGNPTTRENIVNVFGAKTLTALIAMDLKLELDTSSGPSQRWNTTEGEGGKKEIRIVGHISRPATGEGRQTPDRQMFFVNSRPCGLPQVAKAFNEVYKSYNGSQSPFIFANIELDTHMYDVNVSPDKRTILLHDQNRMLENLKEALTALFESQDYTVPISQLPAQKQPSYRQLTISRDSTTPSKTPQPDAPRSSCTPAESRVDDASESDSGASQRQQSVDSEDSPELLEPSYKRRSPSRGSRGKGVSRKSMSKDHEPASLISNWLGRNTEDRPKEAERASETVGKRTDGPPKEKLKLVEKLTRHSQKEQSREVSEEPQSPISESQSPLLFVSDSREPTSARQRSSSIVDGIPEHPIPSLQSPSKPLPSIADKFSSSAKSYRAPAEVATITIGNHTVTSTIGTPCPKRSKLNDCASTARQPKAHTAKLPSFGSILSQRFAASGTVTHDALDDGDDDNDDGIEDKSHEPVSSQLIGGSSPESRDLDQLEEESQDDIDMNSVASERKAKETDPVRPFDTQKVDDEDSSSYIDEVRKKVLEEVKVQEMIKEAEDSALLPSQENDLRARVLLKGGTRKKESTVNLIRQLETSASAIEKQSQSLATTLASYQTRAIVKSEDDGVESKNAEERLALTISKSDFAKMKIVGQFNLGFILASRTLDPGEQSGIGDDLFIIDQHASDEKYNFERLQATTIVQSQRLVHPKILDLTAMEEETVMENLSALSTNGFVVSVDESGDAPVGRRCSLVALPLSRETAFSLSDLEELIALLAEPGVMAGGIPRPSKVRKMFAMRACRSSVMIGKTLTEKQMGGLVRHLGELDKPWNCPHGRPTMRHLCGLNGWDEAGWREGDILQEVGEAIGFGDEEEAIERRSSTNWAEWAKEARAQIDALEDEEGVDQGEGEGEEEEMEIDGAAEDERNARMYEAFSSALGNPESEDDSDGEDLETEEDESSEEEEENSE